MKHFFLVLSLLGSFSAFAAKEQCGAVRGFKIAEGFKSYVSIINGETKSRLQISSTLSDKAFMALSGAYAARHGWVCLGINDKNEVISIEAQTNSLFD